MSSAQADQTPGASLILQGTSYLNPTSDLGMDITPLAEQSGNDNRILKWTWAAASNNSFVSGTAGIDMFNNFSAHNFVFWLYGATDYVARNGNVGCVPSNSYSGRFDVRCFAPYNFTLNHTYRIRILNDANKGPTWWYATLEDLQNGSHIEIGDLNSGSVDYSTPLVNLEADQGGFSNFSDCSSAPVTDTVYSNFISGNSPIMIGSTFKSSNVCGIVSRNRGKLGGYVFKIGGSDFGTRNLEGAPPVATDAPVLDISSNTGLSSADNFTNNPSPVVNVSGILKSASVRVNAVDSSGNHIFCDIPAELVVGGAGNCSLALSHSGPWNVTTVQSLGSLLSDVSDSLQITVDTNPPVLSLKSLTSADGMNLPTVTSSKSGIGLLISASVPVSSFAVASAVPAESAIKFAYGVAGSPLSISVNTLLPGKYKLYFEDVAGNFQSDGTEIFDVLPAAPKKIAIEGATPQQVPFRTNQLSPVITIGDLLGAAQITATSSTGQSVTCFTQSTSSSGGSCKLALLADGVWTVVASQTVNSEVSPNSPPLVITVDSVIPKLTYRLNSQARVLEANLSKKGWVYLVPVSFSPKNSSEISRLGVNLMPSSQPKSGNLKISIYKVKSGTYKLYGVDLAGNYVLGSPAILLRR